MRKDRIEEKAYKMALELYYSEGGFHGTGIDADDVPVLRPQVSRLKREDEPWEPNSAFYGNKPVGSPGKRSFVDYSEETGDYEYDAMNSHLQDVMDRVEELGGRLRMARQRGNFQEEHRLVQERNDLLKEQSAIIAKMRVNDLGRAQREMNDGMMYNDVDSFSEYVSAIEENDRRIADLEAKFLEFAEGKKELKSPGGDFAADPGQTYDKADDEEDDEEEEQDEEELGEA